MVIVLQQDGYLWLDEIQISPYYQSQGIGSEIIARLIVRARKLDIPLRLRVLHANKGAYRLYRKLGFEQISYLQHHRIMETK